MHVYVSDCLLLSASSFLLFTFNFVSPQLESSLTTSLEQKWTTTLKQLENRGLIQRAPDCIKASFFLTDEGMKVATELTVPPLQVAADRLNESLAKTAALEKKVIIAYSVFQLL